LVDLTVVQQPHLVDLVPVLLLPRHRQLPQQLGNPPRRPVSLIDTRKHGRIVPAGDHGLLARAGGGGCGWGGAGGGWWGADVGGGVGGGGGGVRGGEAAPSAGPGEGGGG